jgi:hypothetical protein
MDSEILARGLRPVGAMDWWDCVDGKHHGEVLTPDDSDDYDPAILGPTPNGYQYGYCRDCLAPCRWDVDRQRWVSWEAQVPKDRG